MKLQNVQDFYLVRDIKRSSTLKMLMQIYIIAQHHAYNYVQHGGIDIKQRNKMVLPYKDYFCCDEYLSHLGITKYLIILTSSKYRESQWKIPITPDMKSCFNNINRIEPIFIFISSKCNNIEKEKKIMMK